MLLRLGVHRLDQSGPPVKLLWPLSDQLQDRPVRPYRDTGLTGGVSLIGFVLTLVANTTSTYLASASMHGRTDYT
jgi:hypothetical protein